MADTTSLSDEDVLKQHGIAKPSGSLSDEEVLSQHEIQSAVPQPATETPEPSAIQHPLLYAGHEISAPVESAWEQLKTDFKASMPDPKKFADEGMWDRFKDQFRADVASGKSIIDAFNLVTAPISGVVHGAVIRPAAEGMTYGLNEIVPGFMSEPEAEKGISQAMMGIGPEGGAAGEGALATAVRTAKSIPKPPPIPSGPYAEAVKQLQSEGVDLTLGQTHGGTIRRAEEAHKSSRYIGPAIRDAENRSIETFNRAVYNRVLAPIGEKYKGDAIGHEGIKKVGDTISSAYDQIKPKLALKPDDKFTSDLADIRGDASDMPEAQEKQLESIINNRVLKRLNETGAMDGSTFKQVEGELSHLASVYKSSADAAHRELGNSISDVQGAMRQNLERTSDPSVRAQLQKINTAWAMLTRLEGAAATRKASGGVFTTGDLLGAVKTGDKTVRKRGFARGDAMMQDFAETANKVLPNRLPDSGTTERFNLTHTGLAGAAIGGAIGGVPGAAIGYGVDTLAPLATNPLYTSLADALKAQRQYAAPPP
jgi:hypothetical protein